MESSWVLRAAIPVVMPEATTDWTATLTVLERSRSETVRLPEVVRLVLVSVRDLVSELAPPRLKVGTSLVPVTVTVTVEVL